MILKCKQSTWKTSTRLGIPSFHFAEEASIGQVTGGQAFQMTDIGINSNKNNSVYNKKRIVTDRNICEIISELEKTEWY